MKRLKIWAYLDNLFFIVSKTKCWIIAKTIHWFFSIFLLVSPWKLWKKSCLNKLKVLEASRNQKRSICWKFQLSILLGTQKGTRAIGAGPTMIKPFVLLYSFWTLFENVHCQGLCSLRPCISRPYCMFWLKKMKVAYGANLVNLVILSFGAAILIKVNFWNLDHRPGEHLDKLLYQSSHSKAASFRNCQRKGAIEKLL